MIDIEKRLTVDDLIIEYIAYKINNGYEPYFRINEFVIFLKHLEKFIEVKDSLYDGEKLFKRFFERKKMSDWSIKKDVEGNSIYEPHLIQNKDIIKPTYEFGSYDKKIITTYFMDQEQKEEIEEHIKKYLERFQKRTIPNYNNLNEFDLNIGNYISAILTKGIWNSYINYYIKNNCWPRQCTDIEKYLFENDLANIINIKSIKNELLLFYKDISKKISNMYHEDKNLKITNYTYSYLAYSNYKLLTKDYEELIHFCNNNTFFIDIKNIQEDEKIKKLTRNLENEYNMNNFS